MAATDHETELHRSIFVRLGASAGGSEAPQQYIPAPDLARALGVTVSALKNVVVRDLFVEQYHSDCPLPIGFAIDGELGDVCNFITDFRVESFHAMAVLLPKATSLVPYRLNGDSREKSAFTGAYIDNGIADVSEHSVSLHKGSILAQEVARQRQERDAVSATRAEAKQAIASLLRRGRAYDLRDGIHFKTVVLGRGSDTRLKNTENAYVILGITATVRPVEAQKPIGERTFASETEDTLVALEALRVAESTAQHARTTTTASASEAEASDSPLTPLMTGHDSDHSGSALI